MGAKTSKVKKSNKKTSLDILKLESIIKQILYQANLNKERKKGSIKIKENEFIELLKSNTDQAQIIITAVPIVSEIRKVHALEFVSQYCEILLKNSSVIKNYKESPEKVQEIVPYIGSVIYGCERLGIEYGATMNKMLEDFTDIELQFDPSNVNLILPEINSCFEPKLPSESDVNRYIEETKTLCNPILSPNKKIQGNTPNISQKILGETDLNISESLNKNSTFAKENINMISSSQLTASFPHEETENTNLKLYAEKYAQSGRSASLPIPMEMSFGNKQPVNKPVNEDIEIPKNIPYNKSKSYDFVSEHMFPRMSQQERSIYPDFSTYSIDPSKFYNSTQFGSSYSNYQLSDRLNKIRQCL